METSMTSLVKVQSPLVHPGPCLTDVILSDILASPSSAPISMGSPSILISMPKVAVKI